MGLKKEKLDVTVPYIFRGLKFKFGEKILTIREIQGNLATADDGKIGINMAREDGIWFLDGKYQL